MSGSPKGSGTKKSGKGRAGGGGRRANRKSEGSAPSPSSASPPLVKLTMRQRRHLRGLGHKLRPVILIGKEGITDGVVEGLKQALDTHELIKAKLLQNCPLEKDEAAGIAAARSGALLVQRIGKTILLYLPHPSAPTIRLPDAGTVSDDEGNAGD